MANFNWDRNEQNMVQPSQESFDDGFPEGYFPTSGEINWLFNKLSKQLNPVGQIRFSFNPNQDTGYLNCIGETIGNVPSGATYASADYQDLFVYLWTYNLNLVVSPGGRGASALADWGVNKTITLPNLQGVILVGSSSLTDDPFNEPVGTIIGTETETLTVEQIPEMQPTMNDPGHHHPMRFWNPNPPFVSYAWGDESEAVAVSEPGLKTYEGNNAPDGGVLISTTGITINPLGGGQPHNNIQPSMIGRFKIKF